MSDIIHVQAVMNGYGLRAANIIAGLDIESGMLVIAKELKGAERQGEVMLITNNSSLQGREYLFSEDEDLGDAITAYHSIKLREHLMLVKDVERHDPANSIERLDMSVSGATHKISPDITNGQMAVLALALMAERALGMQGAIDFADDFLSI